MQCQEQVLLSGQVHPEVQTLISDSLQNSVLNCLGYPRESQRRDDDEVECRKLFLLASEMAAAWGNGQSWVRYISTKTAGAYGGLASTVWEQNGSRRALSSPHIQCVYRVLL